VEAARSGMSLVADLQGAGYEQEIGLGVYDIHSPQVPPVAAMETLLRQALTVLEPTQLWANPDCGLKTRGYDEVKAALRNLVAATRTVRERTGS
jgi:5-methyltetrahydropteroyltriglutamate--homocysteine methyltransferase